MLTLSQQILISAPKESVQLYLQDLKRLSEYEPKVDKVDIGEGGGTFEAQGKFFSLPWSASFQVELTKDGGYRKQMTRGPLKKMAGGYHLRPVTGGTIVTHDEEYQLPLPLKPLSGVLRSWIARSMELELRAIKEGAERLHRKRQLDLIEEAF